MKTQHALFIAFALALGLTSTACSSCSPGEEPGIMKTQTGETLKWSKRDLPLAVLADFSVADWEPEIKFAIDRWNDELDAPLFIFLGTLDTTGFGAGVHMILVDLEQEKDDPNTVIRFQGDVTIVAAPIRIPTQIPVEVRDRVAVHEFGHALGLAHDPNDPKSVMYPTAFGDFSGEWRVTSHDRRALLQIYNPAKAAEESDAGQN